MRAPLIASLLFPMCAALAAAQTDGSTDGSSASGAAGAERGAYLTIFRSPATGLELRAGHAAAFAGWYPTVLRRDGENDPTSFVRVGGTYYLRSRGAGPYVSPSAVFNLEGDWKHGALTEVGWRGRLVRRLNGRLGVGVLAMTDGRVRVNPTVGMDVALRGAR